MLRRANKNIPYATATSGENARAEVIRILRGLGCESVGFMDDFDTFEVVLAFKHRGRAVQLRASAKGWAAMYIKNRPYNRHRRVSETEYKQAALQQGQVAVNSILRDWIKGQVTAIETGILQFEAVFLPYMITHTGQTMMDRVRETKLLPEAAE